MEPTVSWVIQNLPLDFKMHLDQWLCSFSTHTMKVIVQTNRMDVPFVGEIEQKWTSYCTPLGQRRRRRWGWRDGGGGEIGEEEQTRISSECCPKAQAILLPLDAYYCPRVPPPTLLDGAAKVTAVGNLNIIALLTIL